MGHAALDEVSLNSSSVTRLIVSYRPMLEVLGNDISIGWSNDTLSKEPALIRYPSAAMPFKFILSILGYEDSTLKAD